MIIIKVDHARCKRTFRLLYRATLAIAVSLLFLSGGWVAWQSVLNRVLLPRFGKYLASQVEQRLGWHLTYESISGNLLTTLSLGEVRLEPPHSVIPRELVLAADRLHARYSPLSLMRGRIQQLDVQRPRLILGTTEIALEAAHVRETLELRCPVQRVDFDQLIGWLNVPSEFMVDGPIELEGRWSFRGFRSHTFQLSARGEGLRIRWDPHLDAHTNLALTLTGPLASPILDGILDVTSAVLSGTGVHPVGTALGKDDPVLLRWADRFPGTIHLHLNGANLHVQTDQLQAPLQAALKLQKDIDQPTRLAGTLQASGGTYTVNGLEFRLISGTIRFAERPQTSPELNAVLETRIKRYHIRVAVSGTLAESQMRVSSRPELPREDILALLAFGRPVAALTQEERQTLSGRDEAAQALDLLLLGRAELLAARWLGLDEINVNIAPHAASSTQLGGSPIESVEVGKYVIPERLFGSYKLEPPQTLTEMPRHTVGAALHLTENLSLEGSVTAKVQEVQGSTTESVETPQRRIQAEEAFIRFRWKF